MAAAHNSSSSQLLPINITSYSGVLNNSTGRGLFVTGQGTRQSKSYVGSAPIASSTSTTASSSSSSSSSMSMNPASAPIARRGGGLYGRPRFHNPEPMYSHQRYLIKRTHVPQRTVRSMHLTEKDIQDNEFSTATYNQQEVDSCYWEEGEARESADFDRSKGGGSQSQNVKAMQQEEVNNVDPKDDFSGSTKHDTVVIHVYDETNNINRDFRCQRTTLLQEMKYFQSHLSDSSTFEDIDISVHCDVNIFEWLMVYMHNPHDPPTLDPAWAVSILISSDFLQMDRLVESTLKYLRGWLQNILRLPIDLNCINNELIVRLASLFSVGELEEMKDKKDKIISRLFMCKLEGMLRIRQNTIFRCRYCDRLFTRAQHEGMPCPKAKIFIDYHGRVTAKHVIDPYWSVNHYLIRLKQKLEWREVYWKLWGMVHTLQCEVCGEIFNAAEYGHCSYHPMPAKFEKSSNIGIYLCCNAQVMHFDSSGGMLKSRGCQTRDHTVETDSSHILDMLLKHKEMILVPFESGNHFSRMLCDDGIFSGEEEELNEKLTNLVFHDESDSSSDSEDNDTASDASTSDLTTQNSGYSSTASNYESDMGDFYGVGEHEDEEDDDDEELDNEGRKNSLASAEVSMTLLSAQGKLKYEIFHSFSRHQQDDSYINNEARNGRRWISNSRRKGERFDWSPKENPVKKRHVAMDQQRDEDRRNMDELMKQLGRCRKEQRNVTSSNSSKASSRRSSQQHGRISANKIGTSKTMSLREMQIANAKKVRKRVFR